MLYAFRYFECKNEEWGGRNRFNGIFALRVWCVLGVGNAATMQRSGEGTIECCSETSVGEGRVKTKGTFCEDGEEIGDDERM